MRVASKVSTIVTTFADLQLGEPILRALTTLKHTEPTPIQKQAIPFAMAGKDVLGIAQTGTGKTGGFALPTLARLAQNIPAGGRRAIQVLVLAPTRELAVQIEESFRVYGQNMPVRAGLLIGGVGIGGQDGMLRRGVDIIVATPGRLCDHLNRRSIDLRQVKTFILDEADRMLDMGFIRDVRRIVSYIPEERQTLLFSATLPQSIMKLAGELLHQPERVEVQSHSSTPKSVRQVAYPVSPGDKKGALLKLLQSGEMTQSIVFTRTKHGADKLAHFLVQFGQKVVVLHGNKSQNQRQAALQRYKKGLSNVLVATDIAARGIDVVGVSHVVNFDLPQVPEDYVHRIGRTGRASALGTAFSLVAPAERNLMRAIERTTGQRVEVVQIGPLPELPPQTRMPEPPPSYGRGGQGPRPDSRGRPTHSRPNFSRTPRNEGAPAPRRAPRPDSQSRGPGVAQRDRMA